VKFSVEERKRLNALIQSGKHPARKLTGACSLLKRDAGEAGEGWSDSRIAAALDTGLVTVARVRQQLVDEGFEAVLTPKHSSASARPRIFDGAAEAKRTAPACSEPPNGRPRWTLRLLEDEVVELNIVARVSEHNRTDAKKNILGSWPRYRAGLRVGTSITEGTANFLVNRRMNKSQQMRWSRRGADLLLQVRCAVYNGTLGSDLGHPTRRGRQSRPGICDGGMVPQSLDSPSAMLKRLAAFQSQNQLDRAFQELDRIERTLFMVESNEQNIAEYCC
jgi:hypothetical protein